jgi:hypothetical protein
MGKMAEDHAKYNSRKAKLQMIADFTRMLEENDVVALDYKMSRGIEDMPAPSTAVWKTKRPTPDTWVNLEAHIVTRRAMGKRKLNLKGSK